LCIGRCAVGIIVGVSDFRQDTPSHNLYWSQVINRITERLASNPNLSLQFVGHACEIGTHVVNDSLSINRARKFQNQFLAEVEKRGGDFLDKIYARLEMCEGLGKREPFSFEIEKNNFLFVIRNKNHQEYLELSNLIKNGQKTIKFDPFILKVENDTVKLVSNNRTTFGRQINRRIEILIRNLPGGVYSTF
ncbi:hypothetical protein MJD09_04330, partial [bacterium]|nr:hypothetical protein [bacterium]